jgi:hypothetical protein
MSNTQAHIEDCLRTVLWIEPLKQTAHEGMAESTALP